MMLGKLSLLPFMLGNDQLDSVQKSSDCETAVNMCGKDSKV